MPMKRSNAAYPYMRTVIVTMGQSQEAKVLESLH